MTSGLGKIEKFWCSVSLSSAETRGQPSTEDQEVLRRDFSTVLQGGFAATEKKALEDPFNLHVLASSLDTPAGKEPLKSVFSQIFFLKLYYCWKDLPKLWLTQYTA